MAVIFKRIKIVTCATTQMTDNSKYFSKIVLFSCLHQEKGENYISNARSVFCLATVIPLTFDIEIFNFKIVQDV